MSLRPMSCLTPREGGTAYETMCYGESKNNSNIADRQIVNYCGNVSAQTSTVTTKYYCHLPSNNISGNPFNESSTAWTCTHDINTHYYSSGATCAPSPYLTDGSRNSMYYTTSASTNNCLSYFDGKENTSKLILNHTIDNLLTATSITNSSGATSQPAAACCHLYSTIGTKQGDWYLPSMGEFGYIMPRWNEIHSALTNIRNIFEGIICLDLRSGYEYWTSTEYAGSTARMLSTWDASVSHDSKNKDKNVIAFYNIKID